jgi:two-component sensor histidine kinase
LGAIRSSNGFRYKAIIKEESRQPGEMPHTISVLFDKQSHQTRDETSRKLMKEGQDRVFSIALVH